ncbi:MAG: hypothetical protein ACKODT_05070 [Fluviibacter sp.]
MDNKFLGLELLETGMLPVLMFLAILFVVKFGWFFGNKAHHDSDGKRTKSDDTLIGAVLGLMGLIIAFTFSGAAGRLDQRERLIVNEANTISTAYSSISYLDSSDRPEVVGLFKKYLDERINLYTNVLEEDFVNKQNKAESLLNEIRDTALSKLSNVKPADRALANDLIRQISAISSAYDAQRQAMFFHPPKIIWISLFLLVIASSFLAGYKMGIEQRKERFLLFVFALLMASAVYLILSLEFPLLTHVNMSQYDQEFVRLRNAIPESQSTSILGVASDVVGN